MSDFYIHPTAIVEDGAILGEGVKIWHFAHVRAGAKIGSGTQIGKSCYVDSAVVIGSNCKVQNMVSLYNGLEVEDNVFIGPSAVFTNDLVPRAFGTWKVVPTFVRQGSSIGANSTVVCGNEVGEFSMIAAGAVVTRTVEPYSLVVGVPARWKSWICLCGEQVEEPGIPCTHSQ